MSGSVRICFGRQRPQACDTRRRCFFKAYIYGGALFVNDQIIPGKYFFEWVGDLSTIPKEHRLYDFRLQ